MKDNLLIITNIKKTIVYLDTVIDNFPTKEIVLRDNLKKSTYELLELSYMANIYNGEKRLDYQKRTLVKIKLLDFYLKRSHEKKIISHKKYTTVSNHLLSITKLIQAWIKSEDAHEKS